MTDHPLLTKISLPKLRRTVVPREKVLEHLRAGFQNGHLLTLVSAPAGYGKTTTIRMWVEDAGHPVAWVTLEKSDNDLKQFLTYVLTALQQAGDYLGEATLEVVDNTQGIDMQRILGLLINDLQNLDRPLILVLEDYHLIANHKIDQFIESILSTAVANLHLVITTREDPDLPLARMRVKDQLTEIRAIDLRFSFEEAVEFFSNVMGINLSSKQVEVLEDRTEGWVAGLQLAALSLRESRNPARFVEAFGGTHRHVLDYLIEEVLNAQAEEIREFLRLTSVLDQLSPSLCEAVTGQVACGKYLHYLEDNNLFLVSLEEERSWYRYHALFGELLRNQLLQTEPKRVDGLHERAATWYEKNGLIQKAIEHAFQMSNSDTVVALIEKHALPMLYQGEVSKVAGWFERLPKSLMRLSPILCISKAWSSVLMLRRTRTEEVVQALQAADDALNLAGADRALRDLIAGHTASIQAYVLRSPALAGERPEKLIETSRKAQQVLPESETAIRSVNALNIGYGYAALGDVQSAEGAFEQALEDGISGGNLYAAIYGPTNLIMIALAKGQLADALRLCETNIDRFSRLIAAQSFPPIGALHILKGGILLEGNHLAEADEALSLGLSLVRWTGEFIAHIRGYSASARLHSAQGDLQGMLESTRLIEDTMPEAAIYARALRHRLSLRDLGVNKSSLEEARHWVMGAAVNFNDLSDAVGLAHVNEIRFQTLLCSAHVLARLAARNLQAHAFQDVYNCLERQETFAESRGLAGRLVEIRLVRALLYQAEGRAKDALGTLRASLDPSMHLGYFRVYLDEADLVRPLLESTARQLRGDDLSPFVEHLLSAMSRGSAQGKTSAGDGAMLRDRELEVLRLLAAGSSYRDIGQQLYLSLNTVQFHVKNIYGKLAVNRRTQAIEKARELNLV